LDITYEARADEAGTTGTDGRGCDDVITKVRSTLCVGYDIKPIPMQIRNDIANCKENAEGTLLLFSLFSLV
jgi:hypothetical protein